MQMGWLSSCSILCLLLFLFHSLSCCSALPSCRTDQSSALLHFKNSFSIRKPSPSSTNYALCGYLYGNIPWPNISSWRDGTNCCSWDGVTCNKLGHVIGLNLHCSSLNGKILPNNSLFKLNHLQMLDLSGNDFQRSHIPSNFSQLVSLTHLSLSFSNFSGEVPSQISHLHKLVSFDLAFNGKIINSRRYDFYPYVSLKQNTWDSLVKNLTNIEQLALNGVDMSSIPPSHLLKNLSSSLLFLMVGSARLQGNFDEKIPFPPQLQFIDFSVNVNLTGYLPKSNWSSSLAYLDLRFCQFMGKIPSSFWNLTQLTYLDLSFNNFFGPISSISNLRNLMILDLSSNNFSGHLPDEINGFSNLTHFDLSHNSLNGTLPFWCFNLPTLKILDVSSNQFSSQIGEISSNSLRMLDLSDNNLHGSIPRSLYYLQNLKFLNLSHNSLAGIVEFHPVSWKHVSIIDLSSNLLEGQLTSSICNATSLEVLNLSHDNFTGTIPHCVGSSSLALVVLDLQNNSFSGTIPETFELGNNFRTLNLNGNLLEGSLPHSLVNCTKLEVLDLGRNGIKDTFPSWLQVLEELQVLVLRENMLYGSISNFMEKTNKAFPKVTVFDLSSNNLSGTLPATYFKSFNGMRNVDGKTGLQYMRYELHYRYSANSYHDSIEVTMKGLDFHLEKILTIFTTLDLSNNMFEGDLPKVIGELGALKGFNFSHNRLTGAIPNSIGNLGNLEWLDLSSNKFIGKIPVELTNLNFLSVLNLSQNQLEGCIPRGQQFETFSSDSFEGNKGLRGFPLAIPCITHEETKPQPSSEIGYQFGWKPVVLGYVCGAAFGATMGWFVIKPQWIARLMKDAPKKRRRARNRT